LGHQGVLKIGVGGRIKEGREAQGGVRLVGDMSDIAGS